MMYGLLLRGKGLSSNPMVCNLRSLHCAGCDSEVYRVQAGCCVSHASRVWFDRGAGLFSLADSNCGSCWVMCAVSFYWCVAKPAG